MPNKEMSNLEELEYFVSNIRYNVLAEVKELTNEERNGVDITEEIMELIEVVDKLEKVFAKIVSKISKN